MVPLRASTGWRVSTTIERRIEMWPQTTMAVCIIVISGLALGLTIAILAVPPLVKWAQPWLGADAWRVPFLLMSVPTFAVGFIMMRKLRSDTPAEEKPWIAIGGLLRYGAIFFAAIMAVYTLGTHFKFSPSTTGLVLAGFAVALVAFAIYVALGIRNTTVLATLLFVSGLFFFALQSVSHALTAELAPPAHRGAACGLWNLIAEIGALLAPVLSGTLRDSYGGWAPALYVDAALMGASCLLVLGVRPNARRE